MSLSHPERIYVVAPHIIEAPDAYPEWINTPPGPRAPGPHPIPEPNRLQIGSGFPKDLPAPVLRFTKKLPKGTQFMDAYYGGFFWYVSVALRDALFGLDPEGFDAVKAQLQHRSGDAIDREYWVIDLVRFSESLDLEASILAGARHDQDRRVFDLERNAPDKCIFRKSALSGLSIFRLPRSLSWICTDRAKHELEIQGLTNLRFRPIGWAR